MRKIIYTILLSSLSFSMYGQVILRGGMGINFQNTPSLNDYLNRYYSSPGERLGDFNSVIVFSLEGGYMVKEEMEAALEIGYLISSYTFTGILGKYEFFYNVIMPSFISYYVISGTGYQIKFGAGAGVRLANIEETQPGSTSSLKYNTTGFGVLLRADGNTLLGGNFYANIGLDARYDLNGSFTNLVNEEVDLNALSFGLRLGLAFIF